MFNQNEIIKKQIKDFFKTVQMEGEAYTELITSREEIKGKYEGEYSKLMNKKEKLWKSMDQTKWEITEGYDKLDSVLLFRDKFYAFSKMCTADTAKLNNLKRNLGYANRNNLEELKSMITKYRVTFIDSLKDFCNKFYPTISDALDIWTKIASDIGA